jgi:ATP phosphoribosyltransferase regulatory subunit
MEYYTGITFKGYTPGLGFSVCSGGRYDDLLGHFGRPRPAVGCALWVDRILLARQRQGWQPAPLRPDLVWLAGACPDCLRTIVELRRRGLRVEMEVLGANLKELPSAVAARGVTTVVACSGAGMVMLATTDGLRPLSLDEFVREAAAW